MPPAPFGNDPRKLDAFLEIEELRCLEINNDAIGPPSRAWSRTSGGCRRRAAPS